MVESEHITHMGTPQSQGTGKKVASWMYHVKPIYYWTSMWTVSVCRAEWTMTLALKSCFIPYMQLYSFSKTHTHTPTDTRIQEKMWRLSGRADSSVVFLMIFLSLPRLYLLFLLVSLSQVWPPPTVVFRVNQLFAILWLRLSLLSGWHKP